MISNVYLQDQKHLQEHDTEVTLERNPKTDGPRRAKQKGDMRCRERSR
jgi:hypothetical protein